MQDKSQEFIDLMNKLNNSLTYYVIEPATKVIGEEGKYVDGGDETVGYAIINSLTGVTEHTSVLLPSVIWQARHFDSTLKSLVTEDETPESVKEAPVDDVVLN